MDYEGMSLEELFALLTPENKRIILAEAERLRASRSSPALVLEDENG